VAIASAGTLAYYDKFKSRAERDAIEAAAKQIGHKLDIIDFCTAVCEPVVTGLIREYEIERARALGYGLFNLDLTMIVGGATRNGEIQAYFVHPNGLTEPVYHYGTIGSGASYAELFLRYLLSEKKKINCARGAALAVYAIKGVELIDPHVGGQPSVRMLRAASNKLQVEDCSIGDLKKAKEKMEKVLKKFGSDIESLVGRR
jgi:20S proteasome alpha/beta subunit